MLEKYIEAIENLDWWVNDEGNYLEIGMISDAGEDFSFSVDKNDIYQGIYDYACDFDPEEHAEEWIEAKNQGVAGVPSIRVLLNDADSIAEYLDELVGAVKKVWMEEN